MRHRRTTRSGAIIALGLCVAFVSLTGCSPKVYQLHEAGGGKDTINVVFLGDGFTEAELQSYRAATYFLTERLLETEPFCHIQDRMNFYRIDNCDSTQGIPAKGSCSCPSSGTVVVDPSFVEPSTPPVVSGLNAIVKKNLRVCQCESANSCKSMWPVDDGRRAFELARHAPNPSLVVVLANSQAISGNGHWMVYPGSEALAVVSLPMIATAGDWDLTPTGYHLFAHELGHALGLIDESTTGPSGDIAFDRNVWFPPNAGPWTSAQNIPWSSVLPMTCSAPSMKPCCGQKISGPCDVCSGVNGQVTHCSFVPAACQFPDQFCPSAACPIPSTCPEVTTPETQLCREEAKCNDNPGAWEGAAYTPRGAYRSSWRCRMGTLGGDAPFCKACGAYLWRRFRQPYETPDPASILGSCPTVITPPDLPGPEADPGPEAIGG